MAVRIHPVFPSIITEVQCPNFDLIQTSLIDWIYNYQSTTNSVYHSNRGGWQSPSDFWQQESFLKYYDYLCSHILSSISFYNVALKVSSMWINVNQKGDYNVEHDHPNSILSGVFWVNCPQNCGILLFNSPNLFVEFPLLECVDDDVRQKLNYSSPFPIVPKDGLMLLFPSHLRHWVEQNNSDEDRISISFNLNFKFLQ